MKKFLLMIAAMLSFAGVALCETHVAVLADDATQPVADLLVTALSKDPGLVLIERAEIDKVVHEAKLPVNEGLQNDLGLARLLHADGVLILQNQEVQGKQAVWVRLAATTPGAVIGAGLFGGESNEMVSRIVTRYQPLWSKLTVPKDKAIPVSLLNLRFALQGSEPVETQLTFLLAHQIMQQRELFVLERWRLDDLSFEKGLAEWKGGEFWNGSYVVDGSLESMKDGKIKATVFLRPPGKREAERIEATGGKDELPKLAGELAARITSSLVKHPGAPEWKQGDESNQYFEEAKWAFGARLFTLANAAAESSWALGNRDPELAYLRSGIFSALAFPPPQHQIEGPGLRPSPEHPYRNGYTMEDIDVNRGPGHARAALQALEYFQEYAAANPGRGEKNRTAEAGRTALEAASRVLRNYFDRGLLPDRDAALLSDLRGRIRETADIVLAMDDIANKAGVPGTSHAEYGYPVKYKYLQFWYDTPAQELEAYRSLLEKHPGSIWDYLWARRWSASNISETVNLPWLVGWKGESREELGKTWEEFLASLEKSSQVTDVLNATLLRLSVAWENKTEKAAVCSRFQEVLWDKRDEIFQRHLEKIYLQCLNPQFPPDEYRCRWMAYVFKHYDSYDFVFISSIWHPEALTKEQGPEALSLFRKYRKRIEENGSLAGTPPSVLNSMEAQLLRRFPDLKPDTSTIKKVEITRHWQPDFGDAGRHFFWQEDKLWVALGSTLLDNASPRHYHIRIVALDVPSFAAADTIDTTPEMDAASSTNDPLCYVTPTSVYLYDYYRIYRFDRSTRQWTKVPLPEKRYSSLLARGDELFAAFSKYLPTDTESGILKWSAATGEVEVLASNRRRPGLNELDDCPAYRVDGLCSGSDGKLGVKAGKFYWCTPNAKTFQQAFPEGLAFDQMSIGNTTLWISRRNGVAAIDNENGKSTMFPGSCYTGTPDKWPAVYLPEGIREAPTPGGVKVNPNATAYAGGPLWTLRRGRNGSESKVVLNRSDRLDQQPSPLSDAGIVFKSQPVKVGGVTEAASREEGLTGVEDLYDLCIAATSHGLVFKVSGSEGLWFMPEEDFGAAPAAAGGAASLK